MDYQFSFIEREQDLGGLPSAKIKRVDKVGIHSWINFYAAYSENFVFHVLDGLGVKPGDVVYDPFVGSGTTGVAAKKIGAAFVGGDLDAFACLLARAKLAVSAKIEKVERYLKVESFSILRSFDAEAPSVFDEDCLLYASTVFSRIHKNVRGGRKGILRTLCSDTQGRFDSEIVALVAVCIAASFSAKLVKGSNPTWYRRGIQGEYEDLSRLQESAPEFARKMIADLAESGLRERGGYKIYKFDARNVSEQDVLDGSVDFIITSPPYLTRIDYVVNHLPNLLMLSGMLDVDIGATRRSMIGTPKIVSKATVDPMWGEECRNVLRAIESHNSYASKRYYYWTYVQYFESLFSVVEGFYRKMAAGGKGVLVVQSSFYKDVYIPLSNISVEMMRAVGFSASILRTEDVKINMKNLQASREGYERARRSSEDVVFFEKINNGML